MIEPALRITSMSRSAQKLIDDANIRLELLDQKIGVKYPLAERSANGYDLTRTPDD